MELCFAGTDWQDIPPGLAIPHLRDALVKILQDFNLQVYEALATELPALFHSLSSPTSRAQIELRKGCASILLSDSVSLLRRLQRLRRRACAVQGSATCQVCHSSVCDGCKPMSHYWRHLTPPQQWTGSRG